MWDFNNQDLGSTMDVRAEHGFRQDLRAQLQIHDFENSALKCCLTLQLSELHNAQVLIFKFPSTRNSATAHFHDDTFLY